MENKKVDELEIIGELNENGLSYEFNTLRVYADQKEKRYYWATDSGCSCPCPFESVRSTAHMTEIKLHEFLSFERVVDDFPADLSERTKLKDIVRRLLELKKD